jgi:hypothetical protein
MKISSWWLFTIFARQQITKLDGKRGALWRQHSSLNLPTIRLSACLTGINIQFPRFITAV